MDAERGLRGRAYMTRSIDTRRLFYFLEVARLGSFRKAEYSLKIAQSALSRHIQNLESDLGVVLLERYERGVRLTDMGHIVLKKAEEIVRLVEQTREVIKDAREEPVGEVRLGASPTFASTLAAKLISRLRKQHTGILLKVSEGPTGPVHDWIVRGEVDVAIIVGGSPSKLIAEETLYVEELYLVGARNDPVLSKGKVSIRKLSDLPMILPSSPHGIRRLVEAEAALQGATIKPCLEADSLPIIKQLLLSEQPLYGILPALAIQADIDAGILTAAPLDPPFRRTVAVAVRRDLPQSRATRTTIQELFALVERERLQVPIPTDPSSN
jgi:LysR family nitrogen assimilation transcriptional regulator